VAGDRGQGRLAWATTLTNDTVSSPAAYRRRV